MRELSSPSGLGTFFTRSLAASFLPTLSSLNKEPAIGFSPSNVEIS